MFIYGYYMVAIWLIMGTYGSFLSHRGYPQNAGWLIYKGKSQLEMDDDNRGNPYDLGNPHVLGKRNPMRNTQKFGPCLG